METKYIKTEAGDIIVFPASMQHVHFKNYKPVSAGFISFYTNRAGNPACHCYGKSVSLDMESNPEEDTRLAMRNIMNYDYGLVEDNIDSF